MKKAVKQSTFVVAAAVAAAGLFGGGWALGAGAPGTFTACLKSGQLINVAADSDSPTSKCVRPAVQVSWSATGPQGPPGKDGVDGIDGVDGDDGKDGVTPVEIGHWNLTYGADVVAGDPDPVATTRTFPVGDELVVESGLLAGDYSVCALAILTVDLVNPTGSSVRLGNWFIVSSSVLTDEPIINIHSRIVVDDGSWLRLSGFCEDLNDSSVRHDLPTSQIALTFRVTHALPEFTIQ